MLETLTVPKLGNTVEEVTIVEWLVDDGAAVQTGQELLEIETDKAVFTVESPAEGTLHRGPFHAGDIVPVLEVVAVIGAPADSWESYAAQPAPAPAAATGAGDEAAGIRMEATPPAGERDGSDQSAAGERIFASPRARRLAAEKEVDLAQLAATGPGGRIVERDVLAFLSDRPKASPLARRLAQEGGIDVYELAGSGPGGRVMKKDVEQALSTPAQRPAEAAPPSLPTLPEAEVAERIPLKGIRGIIAERMGTSVHTTARVTLMMEVDASAFVEARARLKATVGEAWGFAPGYNDLLALIVARALRKFPYMNARLAEDAIERLARVHLGMAVDTERGLIVPVLRDADRMGLRALGEAFRDVVDRARRNRLSPDELTGGTFTITNLGMYDIDAFTPVINLPEAAILGVGRIAPKPVVRDEQVVVRQMWTLSLVFDHRLVDGAPAARFLQFVKQLIEEPYLLLAE